MQRLIRLANPPSDPTVGLCLGPYGGPGGGQRVLMSEVALCCRFDGVNILRLIRALRVFRLFIRTSVYDEYFMNTRAQLKLLHAWIILIAVK